MAVRKIAISLPEEVLAQVDDLARRLGQPRSRVIATILARVAERKRDDDLKAAVDALFDDPEVASEQQRTAEGFRAMGPWRAADW